jgi:SAM-dependent methyltransferase
MQFARTLWVYDNVLAGTSLLDIGCGVGLLALLKRKNVRLSGVDISDKCVEAAKANGYEDVRIGELTSLPFPDSSFDYVASLDVFGHIPFDEKDRVLAEIKRVLKPDGVTLHGIECLDPAVHKSYAEMNPEELRQFVAVDGHVGLELAEQHAERFGRMFEHVAFEPRYVLCLSSEEFVKQADEYGLPYDADFVDYLRNLSRKERRAFDMAMGYVFNRISELDIKLPSAGLYTFLKASDVEFGPFYNEHRDRSNLLAALKGTEGPRRYCLDRSPHLDEPVRAEFDHGWHPPDILPPVARWMREEASVRFQARELSSLSFDLTTHFPDLGPANPLVLRVELNETEVAALSIFRYGWVELRIDVPDSLRRAKDDVFELRLRSDRTFIANATNEQSDDDRELSIAVCNIQVETD